MGQSTNGILLYGYNLAGGDSEWQVREVGEYGELQLDWYDNTSDEADDFETQAEKRLLASVGFTEKWAPGVEGYWDREREAKARLGVEFESYCSGEYPMYALAAKGSVQTAHRGDCDPVDFTVQPDWDDKLRAALEVLGMTPTQDKAKWLLCSWWG
jgi:hypothetical protein